MAVFRVEKSRGYTVMSNHHLRNKELSLKAKGLLSQMLSLPEDWDYTLAGLSHINRESIDAIRTAVWELEKAGYITRRQGRDEKGKMAAIEYTIYEQPQPLSLGNPMLENPTSDKPVLENPTTENPTSDNPTQINKEEQRTDLSKKEKSNTDLLNTHSIPILSPTPSPLGDDAAEPQERKRKEAAAQSAFKIYEEIIKDNIEYDILKQNMPYDYDRLDEIVDLMLETVCTRRKTIRIAGDDYPAELVKAKFMKLDSEHIRFVLDCMRENTTKIRNIKQYLRAALFNAPSTIGNYYTSLVAHDMASGALAPRKPKFGDPDYYSPLIWRNPCTKRSCLPIREQTAAILPTTWAVRRRRSPPCLPESCPLCRAQTSRRKSPVCWIARRCPTTTRLSLQWSLRKPTLLRCRKASAISLPLQGRVF